MENDEFEMIHKKYEINLEITKYAKALFSLVVKDYVNRNDVIKQFKNKHFKGVYIVSNSDFQIISKDETTIGMYKKGRIYLNEKKMSRSVIIHEMCHAYLDNSLDIVLPYVNDDFSYGLGFNEAIASIISNFPLDMNNCYNRGSYIEATNIFKELNSIYKLNSKRNFKDLLEVAFKKPKLFYSEMLSGFNYIYSKHNALTKENINNSMRLAFLNMVIADHYASHPYCDDLNLFYSLTICNCMAYSIVNNTNNNCLSIFQDSNNVWNNDCYKLLKLLNQDDGIKLKYYFLNLKIESIYNQLDNLIDKEKIKEL